MHYSFLSPKQSFPASEELAIGNVKFTTYDLGGHQQGVLLFLGSVNDNTYQLVSTAFVARLLP
jgi:hypothetical protein